MQQWIRQHQKDDTARLLLRYHGLDGIKQAVTQIECRQRCAGKIPTFLLNEAFMFPHALSAEQCTSERLAAYHASLMKKGSVVLDMTAGLGIDAMSIASAGCSVTAIERNTAAAAALLHNAKVMGLDNIQVVNDDSIDWLVKRPDSQFDCIFIDPARRDIHGGRVRALEDCEPDICKLLPTLLAVSDMVMIKASPMLDLDRTVTELNSAVRTGSVKEILAVGTETECKEVLATVTRESNFTEKGAVTILKDGTTVVTKASSGVPRLLEGDPQPGMWLYEPYPSVMKLMNRFVPTNDSFQKLDRDTNLYMSEKLSGEFPGIAMKIELVEDFNDRNMRKIGKECVTANVATRNFIISAPELVKRLRIKEGGKKRIYGTSINGRLKLIQTAPPESE